MPLMETSLCSLDPFLLIGNMEIIQRPEDLLDLSQTSSHSQHDSDLTIHSTTTTMFYINQKLLLVQPLTSPSGNCLAQTLEEILCEGYFKVKSCQFGLIVRIFILFIVLVILFKMFSDSIDLSLQLFNFSAHLMLLPLHFVKFNFMISFNPGYLLPKQQFNLPLLPAHLVPFLLLFLVYIKFASYYIFPFSSERFFECLFVGCQSVIISLHLFNDGLKILNLQVM